MAHLDVLGRRVLLRADLDIPVSAQGGVLDDTRIRELLPTIRQLRARRAKVIVAGAFASPARRGAQEGIGARLGELLGVRVATLSRAFIGEIQALAEREVALLPDLASFPEEARNDARWSSDVARAVDAYVNDAPRASRERTASVEAIPRRLAARGAGPILGRELDMFYDYAEAPARPYAAVIGGGSVVLRERLFSALLSRVDSFLLGGVVANTFLVARGWSPGTSVFEPEGLPIASFVMKEASMRGIAIHLPIDAVVATRAAPGEPVAYAVRKIEQVGANDAVVDVALETCLAFRDVLIRANAVVWNGAMGECSNDTTQSGTIRVAQAATETSRFTLVVGDHTVTTARLLRLDSLFRDVAVGGDASLTLLRGVVFPGIEALRPGLVTP